MQAELIHVNVWFGLEKEAFSIFEIHRVEWPHVYEKEYLGYTQGLFVSYYTRHEVSCAPYSEFTSYIHSFNLYFRFFYSIFVKEKIQLCLFSNIPHEGADLIIYLIAKFFKIPTIILSQTIIEKKMVSLESIEEFGTFPHMDAGFSRYEEIPKTAYTHLGYMQNIAEFKKPQYSLRGLLRKSLRPKKFLENFHKSYHKYNLALQFYEQSKKHSVEPNLGKKFVYFPLHLQPELSTSALGGAYCDQLLAVERLSELIPDDWVIYIKENPKQTAYMRPNLFFTRLKLIQKAQFIEREVSTYQLIRHSQFVATISGTVGWEAIKGGKCALIFGKAWYQSLPGVFMYSDGFDLSKLLKYEIIHEEFEAQANALFNRMWDGVLDPDYINFLDDYSSPENIESIASSLEILIANARR